MGKRIQTIACLCLILMTGVLSCNRYMRDEPLIEASDPDVRADIVEVDDGSAVSDENPREIPQEETLPVSPETVPLAVSDTDSEHAIIDSPTATPMVEEVHLEFELNTSIKRCIKSFRKKRKRDLLQSLERGRTILPMVKRMLLDAKLPQEIAWMPIIESGYRHDVKSRASAAGLWQFMPIIARQFGLRVDAWVDERLDPELSTEAALKALKYFYGKTHCWLLSFAAYNTGEGRIFNGIKELGVRDFWQLHQHKKIPSQTRFYVAAILAIEQISRHPEQYGIDFGLDEYCPRYAVFGLPRQTALQVLAECADVSIATLKRLNPALKRGWTPPDYPHYPLKIPIYSEATFQERYATLPESGYVKWTLHTILPGDTLGRIASRYQSTVQEIMKANRMNDTLIIAGKTLMVPVGLEVINDQISRD